MRFSPDSDESVLRTMKAKERTILEALDAATSSVHEIATARATGRARDILQSKNNSYAVVLTTDFNAGIAIRDTYFLMFVNFGFCKFYSELTRMLFSRISVVSESMHKAGAQPTNVITIEETARTAKLLMEAFWNKELPDDGSFPVFDLQEGTNGLYRLFLVYGLRFAVGHELAHLLIEVLPDFKRYKEGGERFVKQQLSNNPGVPSAIGHRLVRDWGLEFGADVLGLELSIEAEERGSFKWFQMYAAEWFFVMCDMLFRYHAATRGSIKISTHPAPFMRLGTLRGYLEAGERKKDLTQLLEHAVALVFDELGLSKYGPKGRVNDREHGQAT